jgi:hypothetical protein
MDAFSLGKRIEQLFADGLRAGTSLGIAAHLGVHEDDALVALVGLVTSGRLVLIEIGNLLIFLTPAYSRDVELAA